MPHVLGGASSRQSDVFQQGSRERLFPGVRGYLIRRGRGRYLHPRLPRSGQGRQYALHPPFRRFLVIDVAIRTGMKAGRAQVFQPAVEIAPGFAEIFVAGIAKG